MDVEALGGAIAKRARKRRRKPAAGSASPTIHVTVNIGGQAPARRRRAKGSVQPGRPGDVIANDRSRIRRIGPSPS
jgi:hypothetical protein